MGDQDPTSENLDFEGTKVYFEALAESLSWASKEGLDENELDRRRLLLLSSCIDAMNSDGMRLTYTGIMVNSLDRMDEFADGIPVDIAAISSDGAFVLAEDKTGRRESYLIQPGDLDGLSLSLVETSPEDTDQSFRDIVGEGMGAAALEGFTVNDSLLEQDYSTLANEGPRFGFINKLVRMEYDVPHVHKIDMVWADIMGYVEYTKGQIAQFMKDESDLETTRTAAESVWRTIRTTALADDSVKGVVLEFFHKLDAKVEETYGVNKKKSPENHPEPIVATFYGEFKPHLNMPLPGDRSGGWDIT